MENFQLVKASVEDAELIWKMQVRAFADLLARYQDYETNPANEPIARVAERLEQPETFFYLLQQKGEPVGAIRVVHFQDPALPKRISPLFILPEYQNCGLAQQAIAGAEQLHGAHNWQLETILQEPKNCHLYEKMGYRPTGKTATVNERLTLIYYAKE